MSHYRAVLPPKYPCDTKTITIVDLISIIKDEYDEDYALDFTFAYVSPIGDDDTEEEAIGTVIFSKDPSLFPLITDLKYGASVELKGKTYHLSYDENDMLTLGHDQVLYSLENEDFVSDCMSLYEVIWELEGSNLTEIQMQFEKEFVN